MDPEDAYDDPFYIIFDPQGSSLWTVDLGHLISGIVVVGLLGVFQIALTLMRGSFGIPTVRTGGRGGDDRGPSLVVIILVVVGACKAMWVIWKAVRKAARSQMSSIEGKILDVNE
ncbi:hypothetical protein HKX48_002692 [Thoreauomyces humboldtii]|nr:hypothetical protein HKX48_002692 [Thoreauomyces humboldtii]